MKTYTLEEYQTTFHGKANPQRRTYFKDEEYPFCRCFSQLMEGCYDNCSLCLGYGQNPIPMSELRC